MTLPMPETAYIPMTCKTALHKVSGGFPYKLDLNIYRGCENGCKYCFAIYSHRYMASADTAEQPSAGYYNRIYVKTNVAAQLEKELSRPGRKKTVINIGGVCDSYQRAEADYELMRDVLKVMLKHKNPVILSTKSDLILRDFDLLDELSKETFVNIASTITTADEALREKIEPGAVSTKRRFDMLKQFGKTDATIGVHMMPILPFLTDSPANLEAVFSKTKEADAEYIIVQPLYLRTQTKKTYLDFIAAEFPDLLNPLKQLYRTGKSDPAYKKRLYERTSPLLKKYELSTDYMTPVQNAQSPENTLHQSVLSDF